MGRQDNSAISSADHRGRGVGRLLVVSFLMVSLSAAIVFADGRTDYLVRLLRDSSAFRVRAQAALSLSKVERSQKRFSALVSALSDRHPAVRLAAITSLETIGEPKAIDALKSRTKDNDRSVRQAAQRAIVSLRSKQTEVAREAAAFYVSVSDATATTRGVDRELKTQARDDCIKVLEREATIRLAPQMETAREAAALIEQDGMRGFSVRPNIESIDRDADSVRVVVAVILSTYPGENIRATSRGTATAKGGDPKTRQQQALRGAIRSALSRIRTMMEASRPGL